MCHEYSNGLVHKHFGDVKHIFLKALNEHWRSLGSSASELQYLRPSKTQRSAIFGNVSTTLPAVPDVAIHYRCGDNTIGHYGFLPFRAFTALVPKNARQIYVMTESSQRKSRQDQLTRCDAILKHLHLFLLSAFPSATVLLMRGQDIFEDMYRLTYAATTICSVSTFCLWPAIAANGSVHFPVTRLVAKATTPKYGSNFHWITDPPVLSGVRALSMSNDQVIRLLKTTN